jgi:transposase
MPKPPAPSRIEMESRRLSACKLLNSGVKQSKIARQFEVSRTTVSRWDRKLLLGGFPSLFRRSPPGRPCRLKPEQLAELRIMLDTPGKHGCRRWTIAGFTAAIQERFGITYDPDHIGWAGKVECSYGVPISQAHRRNPLRWSRCP